MRAPTRIIALLAALGALLALAIGALAQTDETEERSTFIRFVENRISSPNAQIRLYGIEGTLSSNVSFREITVSDGEGVWLRITKPQLVWSRAALLAGRVEVDTLKAERIDWTRNPGDGTAAPAARSAPTGLPDLPVAVEVRDLAVPLVRFGAPVFGLAADLSLDGRLRLVDGALDTSLAVRRLDGPGGSLTLAARYANDTRRLALDLRLSEPQGGVAASLLNLPGRPPVELAVTGDAPLDDLTVALAFDVAAQRILDGALTVDRRPDGLALTFDLGGPLARILPESQRAFFGPTSRVRAEALVAPDGSVRVDQARIEGGALALTGSARTLPDGFLAGLGLDITLTPPAGERVTLPGRAGTTLAAARLRVDYDGEARAGWTARLEAEDVRTGKVRIGALSASLEGTVRDIRDPARRSLDFTLDGAADRLGSDDPALAAALGERITLAGNGAWLADQPLRIAALRLSGETFEASASGAIADAAFEGEVRLGARRLAAFAPLAARDLAGAVDLVARGTVWPISGAFDLTLDGTGEDLALGTPTLDRLLADRATRIEGGAARRPEGLAFRDFRLGNDRFALSLDGRYTPEAADLSGTARIADLSALEPRSSGPVAVTFTVGGERPPLAVGARLEQPSGTLAGRPVEALALTLDGRIEPVGALSKLTGTLGGSGRVDGQPVRLAGTLGLGPEGLRLDGLDLDFAGTRLSGSLTREGAAPILGTLTLDSRDIAPLAALLLQDAQGAANGTVTLHAAGATQGATADLRVEGLRAATLRVGSGRVEASLADLFGSPRVSAQLDARAVAAGPIEARRLTATLGTLNDVTAFAVRADLEEGQAGLTAEGRLRRTPSATVLELDEARLEAAAGTARLEGPARLRIEDETVIIEDRLRLSLGDGEAELSGRIGRLLDLETRLTEVPLALANALAPSLRLSGRVSGTASAAPLPDGTQGLTLDLDGRDLGLRDTRIGRAAVEATITDLRGRPGIEARIEAEAIRAGALEVASLDAQARREGNATRFTGEARLVAEDARISAEGVAEETGETLRVNLTRLDVTARAGSARLLGPAVVTRQGEGITIDAARLGIGGGGTVTVSGRAAPELALDVRLDGVPLELARPFAPRLDLAGLLSGTARVEGPAADPRIGFELTGRGVAAAPLRGAGIAPLDIRARGRVEDRRVALETAEIVNGAGVSLTARGTVPLSGEGLSVSLEGSVPLSAAGGALAARGASLTGTARVSLAVTGSLGAPRVDGLVTLTDGTLTDPQSNLRLTGLTLRASLAGDTVTLDSATARLAEGGTLAAQGTIGLRDGLPADLSVVLREARYSDGRSLATTASGTLTVTGPLAGAPVIGGRIELLRTEIVVPESLAAASRALEVRHIRPPVPVQRTLARAGRNAGGERRAARTGFDPRFDLTIDAPSRIFLRGRGLDAELGGRVRLTGSLSAPEPVGEFRLIRGRLSILGQRIDLEEGNVTLGGNLDPLVYLVASTRGGDVTAFITLSGPASDLTVSFTSQPELPQDEVLARILFGRATADLTPGQIARLATAAAELAGRRGASISEAIRRRAGIDNLDIVEDSQGRAAVRAETYIGRNVYLGVQSSGQRTQTTINLDITRNLKARGSVASDGESDLGIFFEKDY